jgi:hypothetical protein
MCRDARRPHEMQISADNGREPCRRQRQQQRSSEGELGEAAGRYAPGDGGGRGRRSLASRGRSRRSGGLHGDGGQTTASHAAATLRERHPWSQLRPLPRPGGRLLSAGIRGRCIALVREIDDDGTPGAAGDVVRLAARRTANVVTSWIRWHRHEPDRRRPRARQDSPKVIAPA